MRFHLYNISFKKLVNFYNHKYYQYLKKLFLFLHSIFIQLIKQKGKSTPYLFIYLSPFMLLLTYSLCIRWRPVYILNCLSGKSSYRFCIDCVIASRSRFRYPLYVRRKVPYSFSQLFSRSSMILQLEVLQL